MNIRDLVPWRRNIPVRREVESPVSSLQHEMNQLFDRFFEGFPFEPFDWSGGFASFRPRIDVSETDTEVTVSAELPGVDEDDIDVSVRGDALTISGERREEKEEHDRDYYRREQLYGNFQRTIPLPNGIDTDHVSAAFKRGVLTVHLPKTEAARRKKITVQTS